MIHQMLAIWSLLPLPFLNPAWTSGSSWFTYCWSLAGRILSITLLVCESVSEVAQSCPTLCDPMDYSLPSSSIHGIFQARVLEWGATWDECNCAVVWAFFGIAFLWDWNENWPFPVLWSLLSFPNFPILSEALSQHHLLGFEIAQLEFHHLH